MPLAAGLLRLLLALPPPIPSGAAILRAASLQSSFFLLSTSPRRVRRPFTLSTTLTHIEPMPSTSLNCFTPLLAVLLLGGVSPAAGQNNVFTNRAALLVARDANPTAATNLTLDEPSSSSLADSTVLGSHERSSTRRFTAASCSCG